MPDPDYFKLAFSEKRKSPDYQISKGGMEIKATKDSSKTAFLNRIWKKGSGSFKIKCKDLKNGKYLEIGIASISHGTNKYVGQGNDSWGYGSEGKSFHAGNSKSYGKKYQTGDIITVNFDIEAKTCSFSVNGVDQGVAFTNITGNISPAVSIHYKDDTLSLS